MQISDCPCLSQPSNWRRCTRRIRQCLPYRIVSRLLDTCHRIIRRVLRHSYPRRVDHRSSAPILSALRRVSFGSGPTHGQQYHNVGTNPTRHLCSTIRLFRSNRKCFDTMWPSIEEHQKDTCQVPVFQNHSLVLRGHSIVATKS